MCTFLFWMVYCGIWDRCILRFVRLISYYTALHTESSAEMRHRLSFDLRENFPYMQHLTWWRHQMETFSTLLDICTGNSPVSGEFPTQRPVTWSFDLSLICLWINDWVNNREAGDLRRYRAHYDVTVMISGKHYGHLLCELFKKKMDRDMTATHYHLPTVKHIKHGYSFALSWCSLVMHFLQSKWWYFG